MTIARQDPVREEPPPLAEFLAHVHQRRRGARNIFAVVFGAALLAAALVPARYRATASLAVMPSPEFTVRQDAGSHAFSSSALAFDQIMEAETAILQSDDLHEATIRALGGTAATSTLTGIVALYPDLASHARPGAIMRALHEAVSVLLSPWRGPPAALDEPMEIALKRFSDGLRVLPAKDSNVITVNFAHGDAVLAARGLNTMLAQYAERRRRIYNDPQLAVAQRQTDAAASAVQAADAALTAFKSSRGLSDYNAERDLLLKRRSAAAQSLADARAMFAEAQARLSMLDRQIVTLPAQAPLYQENDTDTRLYALDASLVDLRGRMTAAREHYRDSSRLVLGLASQIDAREAERRRMMSAGPPSVVRSGRSPVLDPLLLSRAQAAADREASRAQAESVQGEIAVIAAALRGLDGEEAHLSDLVRRREAAADAYSSASRAAAEQTLTEAEDARRLANVRVIQPARVPPHQTLTKLLIVLAGMVFGTGAACAWLVAKFVRDATFLTAVGLAHATGLPVLAVFRAETLVE